MVVAWARQGSARCHSTEKEVIGVMNGNTINTTKPRWPYNDSGRRFRVMIRDDYRAFEAIETTISTNIYFNFYNSVVRRLEISQAILYEGSQS